MAIEQYTPRRGVQSFADDAELTAARTRTPFASMPGIATPVDIPPVGFTVLMRDSGQMRQWDGTDFVDVPNPESPVPWVEIANDTVNISTAATTYFAVGTRTWPTCGDEDIFLVNVRGWHTSGTNPYSNYDVLPGKVINAITAVTPATPNTYLRGDVLVNCIVINDVNRTVNATTGAISGANTRWYSLARGANDEILIAGGSTASSLTLHIIHYAESSNDT